MAVNDKLFSIDVVIFRCW